MKAATKLHLGCGGNLLPGWVNIDAQVQAGVETIDLRGPLPYSSHSVAAIYSEHFIEHIGRAEGQVLLRECWRVLCPGGRIRLSTPDLRVLAEDFLAARTDRWHALGWAPPTPCQMVNGGMREWGHTFVYDAPELLLALQEAGYVDIGRWSWRESDHPLLQGLESRPSCRDLIVEAGKPLTKHDRS